MTNLHLFILLLKASMYSKLVLFYQHNLLYIIFE